MELLRQFMLWTGLAASGLIVAYRLLWRHRYGTTGIEGHYRRLRGEVVGPGETGDVVVMASGRVDPAVLRDRCFELKLEDNAMAPDARCLVEPSGPLLLVRGGDVRIGDRVTVDAVDTTVRADEALYRHSSLRQAVAALRIARGTWPRLAPLSLALVAAGAMALGGAALPAPPSPEADDPPGVTCDGGTELKGEAPPKGLLQWCQVSGDAHWPSSVQDQVKHGAWVAWWRAGATRQRGTFWFGRPNGTWTDYHSFGAVARVAHYDKGYRSGVWLGYRTYGLLLWRRSFRQGRRHGPWDDFDLDGRLLMRRTYQQGLPQGVWTSWYGKEQGYHIRTRQSWHHGKRDGDWHRWHDNGRLVERGSYRVGAKHGRWEAWDQQGKLLRAGAYRHGTRYGTWRYWRPSSDPTAISRR
jgi:antitoxin component YwqK of YwqJK toxin-antitoxin module